MDECTKWLTVGGGPKVTASQEGGAQFKIEKREKEKGLR